VREILGHLHVQQHETKHSPQGFLMARLWTRLSSRQHGNQDHKISCLVCASHNKRPRTLLNLERASALIGSSDSAAPEVDEDQEMQRNLWILLECTVQTILIDKQLQTEG